MGYDIFISTILPAFIGSFGLYLTFYFLHKKRPRSLEYVGTVKQLFLHPVKSCRGVAVQEAECTWFGLKYNGVYDRHYFVCDPNNKNSIVSLCHVHKIAEISCDVSSTGNELLVKAPNMETLTLPKKRKVDTARTIRCNLYGEISETMDCGDEEADWINRALGKRGLRLVYALDDMKKRIENLFFGDHGEIRTKPDQTYSPQFPLPEQSTYSMLSQSAVDLLNEKIGRETVSVRNFRANILVDGCAPNDEDNWEEIFINDARFFQFSLSDRCTMTTVDPDSPESGHVKKEPLATLRRYRTLPEYPAGPVFGVRLGISQLGKIAVGDKIYVTRKVRRM